ncbi:MAG: hypothetical protein LBN74_08635 [Prevotella sp.]|nr:hypothetical protein [Prevotella sp.]
MKKIITITLMAIFSLNFVVMAGDGGGLYGKSAKSTGGDAVGVYGASEGGVYNGILRAGGGDGGSGGGFDGGSGTEGGDDTVVDAGPTPIGDALPLLSILTLLYGVFLYRKNKPKLIQEE